MHPFEDRVTVIPDIGIRNASPLHAVYSSRGYNEQLPKPCVSALTVLCDGHAGNFAAEYVIRHLPHNLMQHAGFTSGQLEEALRDSVEKTEETFYQLAIRRKLRSGACMVSTLFRNGQLVRRLLVPFGTRIHGVFCTDCGRCW